MIIGGSGKGTSRAGLPAAASSATVDAPLRAMTRCARANAAGMSSRNALTFQRFGSALVAVNAACVGSHACAALVQNGQPRHCVEQVGKIFDMVWLKSRAPCDPPKTSRCGGAFGSGAAR